MVSFYESLDSNAYDSPVESFCVKGAYFYVVAKLYNPSNCTETVVFCVMRNVTRLCNMVVPGTGMEL